MSKNPKDVWLLSGQNVPIVSFWDVIMKTLRIDGVSGDRGRVSYDVEHI